MAKEPTVKLQDVEKMLDRALVKARNERANFRDEISALARRVTILENCKNGILQDEIRAARLLFEKINTSMHIDEEDKWRADISEWVDKNKYI
jgi:hypothetical protein